MTSLWRNFKGNVFFQTVIKVVYYFLFPKFMECCNKLLPNGAADSARCTGLCAHCTCHSTMPAYILSARYREWRWPFNSSNLNPSIPWRYCVWEWCKKLFEIFIRTQNSFWIESHIGEDMGQFSTVQLTKLPQVLGRGSESTRRLMKNILSI